MTTYPLYLLSLIILLIYIYLKRVNKYWKNRGVKGPEPDFFYGNLKDSASRRKHIADVFKEIYDQYPDEKVVGMFRMTTPTLLVRDLDIVKQILVKDFHKFSERGILFSKKGLGHNFFHSDSDTWKTMKGHLTPMFSTGKLKNMLALLSQIGENFLDNTTKEIDMSQEQELMSLVFKYTVATVMACCFSMETSIKDMEIYKSINKDIFDASYITEMDFIFPGFLRKINKSLFGPITNKFCYEIVEFIKNERNGKPYNRNDVMDMLLAANYSKENVKVKEGNRNEISEHVMAGQIFAFFAAGHINTVATLTFALLHLALEQNIQEKLMNEIKTVMKAHNNKLTLKAINEMSYLEMVFLETLRMHPTTNSVQRRAMEDYVIPGTNIEIEKGTYIIMPPLAYHYDEKIYPEPEKFDPERFSSENYKRRHACSFLSFGAGPRTCIAARLAKLQFRVFMIKFLMKYRVVPSQRTKKSYKIDPFRTSLEPEGGLYLNIVPRTS